MVLLALSCGGTPDCPVGLVSDPPRAGAIASRVDFDGAICFGAEMGRRPSVMVLDPSWPDDALSARLAHLALHTPLQPGPSCLDDAVAQEATVRMEELRLREAWGVESPPLAWSHVESAEELEVWLRENPDPAVDGYRLRCAE